MRLDRLFIALLSFFFLSSFGYSARMAIKNNISNSNYLTLQADFRYDNLFYYKHIEAGFGKEFKNDLDLVFKYRIIENRNIKTGELLPTTHRPFLELSKGFDAKNINISFRARQEFNFTNSDFEARNRHRIQFKLDEEILKIQPFFSFEAFYDFKESKYNQTRTDIGILLPKTKYGRPELFYAYIKEYKNNNWKEADSRIVLGNIIEW